MCLRRLLRPLLAWYSRLCDLPGTSVVFLLSIETQIVVFTLGKSAVVPSLVRIGGIAPRTRRFTIRISAVIVFSESLIWIVCSSTTMFLRRTADKPAMTSLPRNRYLELTVGTDCNKTTPAIKTQPYPVYLVKAGLRNLLRNIVVLLQTIQIRDSENTITAEIRMVNRRVRGAIPPILTRDGTTADFPSVKTTICVSMDNRKTTEVPGRSQSLEYHARSGRSSLRRHIPVLLTNTLMQV
jgi:hypothetical protein